MKLVGIGTVKNEADIIESFVRHNLGIVDALVLIDDGSVDGTKEILLSLEAEGLNLVILEWDGPAGHEQSMKLSELLLVLTSRVNIDWVFPLDADEAIDCESRYVLEESLLKVPQEGVAMLPWRTYVPTCEDDPKQQNPFLRIVNRKKQELPQFYKVALPVNELRRKGPVVIASGSHSVRYGATFRQMSMSALENVALAHFPVRTPDQLVNKVVCGWLAMLAVGSGNTGRAFHWRNMFEMFVQKGAPAPKDLENLARGYSGPTDDEKLVYAPLRAVDVGSLKYRRKSEVPFLVTFMRTAEQLITKLTRKVLDGPVSTISQRTAWRYNSIRCRGSLLDREFAERKYLDRRFGDNWKIVNESASPVPPLAYGIDAAGKNLVKAIVLVLQRRQICESIGLHAWLQEGWSVDQISTFAVRLLARSPRLRQCSVVLISLEKDQVASMVGDCLPGPGGPAWREALRLGFLRGYFLASKFYWFLRSRLISVRQQEFGERMGVSEGARSLRIDSLVVQPGKETMDS